MCLLWYSVEEQKYNLEFCSDKTRFSRSNDLDVMYEFGADESKVATKVLKNLNLALQNVA